MVGSWNTWFQVLDLHNFVVGGQTPEVLHGRTEIWKVSSHSTCLKQLQQKKKPTVTFSLICTLFHSISVYLYVYTGKIAICEIHI